MTSDLPGLPDFVSPSRPLTPPIYQAATFRLDDQVYADLPRGGLDAHWYSRYRNPTVDAAAAEIARLEGGEAAFMTASGMAAIAAVLVPLLGAGKRVVAPRQIYGDTRDLLLDLARYGVDVVFVDGRDLDQWRRAAAVGPTAVLYTESLSNPVLDLADLGGLAGIAREAGARLVVDSTFATPYACRPLALGADAVVHSATKFLAGHGDVTAGVVIADDPGLIREVQRHVIRYGACLDPHAAYLVWRGLRTFDVRMERACATAGTLAAELAGRSDVAGVIRPEGDFALLALVVEGGNDRAMAVMRELRVAVQATSLGGTETLVSAPFNSSHLTLTAEELRAAGISEGTIRVCCGLERAADLVADFHQALDRTKG